MEKYESKILRLSKIKPHLKVLTKTYEGINSKASVECKICGYVWDIRWAKLMENTGTKKCPCCSGQILSDKNRLSIIRPDLLYLLKNIEDGENVSVGSRKPITVICPTCKTEYTMATSDLTRKPFSCKRCSDGISRGEKIAMSILTQSNINFKYQYKPKWANGKIYDFYLPKLNIICEIDGEQHRKNNSFMRTTSEKEKLNDKLKDFMAIENGISDIIRIEYNDFVIKNIKNEFSNKLGTIVDFSKIDWHEVFKYCNSSNIETVCSLYNNLKNKSEIEKITGISRKTIGRYIALGRELNMIDE